MIGFVNDFLDRSEVVHKDVNLGSSKRSSIWSNRIKPSRLGTSSLSSQMEKRKKRPHLATSRKYASHRSYLAFGIMLFVNRKDNSIGKKTYDAWCPSTGGGQRKYTAHMGEGILEGLITLFSGYCR